LLRLPSSYETAKYYPLEVLVRDFKPFVIAVFVPFLRALLSKAIAMRYVQNGTRAAR
jgi:hypothetical protein